MFILTGILLGLSTLLFIGPVFFYLLKSSTESGYKAGIAVALGIIIGDIICVCLAIFGFSDFLESTQSQIWLSGIGGLLLLFFGLKYAFSNNTPIKPKAKFKSKDLLIYGLNGFLINFVNPFVFAVWIGFYAISKAKFNTESTIIYTLTIVLIVIFITDVLKAVFAHKISSLIKPEKLKIVYKVFGIIMLLFAIRLFIAFVILLLH